MYKAYVTEALKNLSENVAKGLGREGSAYMSKRYTDILHPPKEPDRTADEIIDDIKHKLGEYE